MSQVSKKFNVTGHRIIYLLGSYPFRILRLLRHFVVIFDFITKNEKVLIHYSYSSNRWATWFSELPFFLIDLFGIPELLQIINDLFHWKNRKLNSYETEIIKNVFVDNINLNVISIDLYKKYLPHKALAFVAFNTICFNSKVDGELLIHEATHCWQYQKVGSVYILRALLAQGSKDGYKYGGAQALRYQVQENKFNQFNYEQQAEIITDYYILMNSGDVDTEKLNIYITYLQKIGIPTQC